MTELVFIQGGTGWRRTWRRRFGEGRSNITVLNGHARGNDLRGDPHGAFSVKWIPRGRAVYRVQGASHALAGDRMVILNQAQPYELEFIDRAGSESLCAFFSNDLVAQAWSDLSRPDLAADGEPAGAANIPQFPDIVFRPDTAVTKTLAGLRESYGSGEPSALAVEETLLELLSGLVGAAQGHRTLAARIPAVKPSTRRLLAARVQRARELIEDSAEEPSLDDLSHASALSKFHLLRLFKAAFGCTPSAYAGRLRMEGARGLLRATSMTVTEIGQALGYESAGAFIRAFRRHFGVTPQAIRI